MLVALTATVFICNCRADHTYSVQEHGPSPMVRGQSANRLKVRKFSGRLLWTMFAQTWFNADIVRSPKGFSSGPGEPNADSTKQVPRTCSPSFTGWTINGHLRKCLAHLFAPFYVLTNTHFLKIPPHRRRFCQDAPFWKRPAQSKNETLV